MNDVMTRFSLSSLLLVSGPLLILIFGKHDLAVAESVICIWIGFGSACSAGKDVVLLISNAKTSTVSKASDRPAALIDLDHEITQIEAERDRVASHLLSLNRELEACKLTRFALEMRLSPDPYRSSPASKQPTRRDRVLDCH